jgi:hypothetical protein
MIIVITPLIIILMIIIWILYNTYDYCIKLIKINSYLYNYEKKNNTKILIITDQNSDFKYYDIRKYFKLETTIINMDDYNSLIIFAKNLKLENKQNIDIIINSYGGDISSNNLFLHIIEQLSKTHNIKTYIHNYAMSAGTLLFLSGDTLYMDEYDIISPTDPQIPYLENYYQSSDILLTQTQMKNISFKDRILINSTKKSNDDNIKIVNTFLTKHIKNENNKNKLLDILTDGQLLHSTPLNKKLLKLCGVNTKIIPYDFKNVINELFEFI